VVGQLNQDKDGMRLAACDMRTGDGIKDYQDRAYPKNAREQGTADLPEPECKNPLKSV
jgi:hypothetical protein